MELAFGPVPSRRLGRSLGINHVRAKTCSYACVYCQLGRTPRMGVAREAFFPVEEVVGAARRAVEASRERGETIDYITLVADGEPTLDINMGHILRGLRALGLPLAVISNASLIDDAQVRDELALADWVSLKCDAASEDVWRRVDRPHGRLCLSAILEGMVTFRQEYDGTLVTETMLVQGANDALDEVAAIAAHLARAKPDVAYLAVPTRPPAEAWALPPTEEDLYRAFAACEAVLPRVELLIGYEGDAFAASGDAEADLLSVTAVHPMRRDAVEALLARNGAHWAVVDRLLDEARLLALEHEGHTYYARSLPGTRH